MTSDSRAPTRQTMLVSTHAAQQYRRRARPRLDLDAARVELERLRGTGEISTEAPEWLNAAKQAPHYLLVGDGVALPSAPQRAGWIATTCRRRRRSQPRAGHGHAHWPGPRRGGENPLRAAVWEFMRPMLSPNLAQLNRDAFVVDEAESTVRLDEHRGDFDLGDLDLGDEDASAA